MTYITLASTSFYKILMLSELIQNAQQNVILINSDKMKNYYQIISLL